MAMKRKTFKAKAAARGLPASPDHELFALFMRYKDCSGRGHTDEAEAVARDIHARARFTHAEIIPHVAKRPPSIIGRFLQAYAEFPGASSSYLLLAYATSNKPNAPDFYRKMQSHAVRDTTIANFSAVLGHLRGPMMGTSSGLTYPRDEPNLGMWVVANFLGLAAQEIVLDRSQYQAWKRGERLIVPSAAGAMQP